MKARTSDDGRMVSEHHGGQTMDIAAVCSALAGQENNDGPEGDALQAASEYIAALRSRVAQLEAAVADLDDSIGAHYAHCDKTGGAGAGCPACIEQRNAQDRARAALGSGVVVEDGWHISNMPDGGEVVSLDSEEADGSRQLGMTVERVHVVRELEQ